MSKCFVTVLPMKQRITAEVQNLNNQLTNTLEIKRYCEQTPKEWLCGDQWESEA